MLKQLKVINPPHDFNTLSTRQMIKMNKLDDWKTYSKQT